MATTKNFALYCLMLCVLTTINTDITLAIIPRLCPSRTTCKHTLTVTCVYNQGRLVHLRCVQRVRTCEYALRATCRPPSTLFCNSSPRQCFCNCVNTRPVQHSRIRQGYY
uniref:8.9 kDa family member n=1 Tax=Rhipicephalus appendiculatus TaxID=34631 RepID=A0A131YH70_RHIAP